MRAQRADRWTRPAEKMPRAMPASPVSPATFARNRRLAGATGPKKAYRNVFGPGGELHLSSGSL